MKFVHSNLTVTDLEKSLAFYREALNLREDRRRDFGKFVMVYLREAGGDFELELRFEKNRTSKINLGDNPTHIAFTTENYSDALKKHQQMNCVAFVNKELGVYFIKDPDGYWLEIISPEFFNDR